MLYEEAEIISKQCSELAEYLDRFEPLSEAADSVRVAAEYMIDAARIIANAEED